MKTILYYICPQFMLMIAIRYLTSQIDLIKEAGKDDEAIAILKRTKFLILLSFLILTVSIVFKSYIGLSIYLILHLMLTQHPLLVDIKKLDNLLKTKYSLSNNISMNRVEDDLN